MTGRDHEILTSYVRQIGDPFGLRDWDLMVLEEPTNDDRFGDCVAATSRKAAEIRFSYNVRQWPPDQLRWVTIRELMHCHLAAMQEFVIDQQPPDIMTKILWERRENNVGVYNRTSVFGNGENLRQQGGRSCCVVCRRNGVAPEAERSIVRGGTTPSFVAMIEATPDGGAERGLNRIEKIPRVGCVGGRQRESTAFNMRMSSHLEIAIEMWPGIAGGEFHRD